jgi:DNA-binding GntR family transcriptional regulator
MARKRADSFKTAIDTLRGELRAGRHVPGARLTSNDIAERLSLSATPVREALYRLAGEGLLQERHGQGFFVPKLQEHDLIALLQLQLQLLLIACEGGRSGAEAAPAAQPGLILPGADATASEERLLRTLAARASPALAQHLIRIQDQLAPYRIAESAVLGEPPSDFASLAEAVAQREPERLRQALRTVFARRIEAAPQQARLQEARSIESI